MKKYYIGIILIALGVIAFVVMFVNGAPRNLYLWVALPLIFLGFIFQMVGMFSVKIKGEREINNAKKKNEELIKSIKGLPPEEAIKLLLGNK